MFVVTKYLFNVTFIACEVSNKSFFYIFFFFFVIFCFLVIDTSLYLFLEELLFFKCNCIPQHQCSWKLQRFCFNKSKDYLRSKQKAGLKIAKQINHSCFSKLNANVIASRLYLFYKNIYLYIIRRVLYGLTNF